MRKLLSMLGMAVVCWLAAPAGEVGAVPLFKSISTIDLGAMSVAVTDGLRLTWGAPVVTGWLGDGVGSYWYTGDQLGASSEVSPEDLQWQGGGSYPPYYGHADSYVNLRIPFAIEGDGALGLTVPFHAEYATGPYPEFDAYGGGPDFCHATLLLVNGEGPVGENYRIDRFQIDRPATYDYLLRADDLWFADGDTGYLNLFAYAEAAVYYWQLPTEVAGPSPVPEPGTLLLLGTGLLAVGLKWRWRS